MESLHALICFKAIAPSENGGNSLETSFFKAVYFWLKSTNTQHNFIYLPD